MRVRSTVPRLSRHFSVMAACAASLLTACSNDGAPPQIAPSIASANANPHADHPNPGDLTPAQKQAIATLRNATNRFHDLAAAKAAGYSRQFPAGCAAAPEGGQGFHYLNETIADDNIVDLLQPELVMYEPGPNGQMQLVGVDYIVPFSKSAERPSLLGVPFMENTALGVWALHIWAWRPPTPAGMFAAWNPNVSCKHAAKATP